MSSIAAATAESAPGGPSGFFTPRRKRLITSIVLALVCAVWIYPLVWMIAASFKPNGELFQDTGLIPDHPTLRELRPRLDRGEHLSATSSTRCSSPSAR